MRLIDITEKDAENFADSQAILDRGKTYYRAGRVKSLEIINNKIVAKVNGNYGVYKVEVYVKGNAIDADCNCPYDGYGCKHIVAVLYKWVKEMGLLYGNPSKKIKTRKLFLANIGLKVFEGEQTGELARAFDAVNDKKVSIVLHDEKIITAKVEDETQYSVCIENNADFFWGGKYFVSRCSCNNLFGRICVHVNAVLLAILKDTKLGIYKRYEKKLGTNFKEKNLTH